MSTIYLVACSAGKLPHAAPAADLYTGQSFKLASALAKLRADRWAILSAKHGLVEPDAVIEPYDYALRDASLEKRRAWGARVSAALHARGYRAEKAVILAPRAYVVPILADTLGSNMFDTIETPLRGLGIGQQLGWLSRELHYVKTVKDIFRSQQTFTLIGE
jgi:hypothetical protein